MPRVVAIVQARMTSTRLPGKVLMDICGHPMLWHVVQRARRAPGVDEVWVATTNDGTEAPIVALCEQLDAPHHCGSVSDVLARYHDTAVKAAADVIVRITSDCPLIAPEVTGRCVAEYLARSGTLDYVSNCQRRTFPRGLDTEVFGFHALEIAHREAIEPGEREHVTPYIWRHPERFHLGVVVDDVDRSDLRWTVDTPDDMALVTKLFGALAADDWAFAYADVLALYEKHPEWRGINSHVKQIVVS